MCLPAHSFDAVLAVQHFSVGFGHSAVYGSEFPFEWFSGHLCGVSTDQLRRKPHVLHRTVPGGGGQYRKRENRAFMSVHAVGGSQHGLFGLQSQWTQGAEKSLWRVPPASAQFVHNGDVGCNGSSAFFKCLAVHVGVRPGVMAIHQSRLRGGVDFFQQCFLRQPCNHR